MLIGQKIRELRKELNISADELACKLGKNRATIYRYEKGDIENLPLDVISPLAEILETTPEHLLGWDKEGTEDATYYQIYKLQLNGNELRELYEYGVYLKSKRK